MKIKLHITSDGLMAADQLLQHAYAPSIALTEMQKVFRSIGFQLSELFEKKRKALIKKATLFNTTKKISISLEYYQAWALKNLLIDLMELSDNPYQKVAIQTIINQLDQKLK